MRKGHNHAAGIAPLSRAVFPTGLFSIAFRFSLSCASLFPGLIALLLLASPARAQTYYFTGNIPEMPEVTTTATPGDGNAIGAIRYNTATAAFEGCNGTTWADIRSGALAGAAGMQGNIQFNSGGVLGARPTFTFTSTGQLGIGTASPAAAMQILQPTNGGNTHLFLDGQYGGEVDLDGPSARGGIAGMSYSSISSFTNVFSPNGVQLYTANNGGTLVAQFGNGTYGDNTSYLSGNVGIGTSAPATKLDVNGGVTFEPTTVILSANNAVLATANRSYFRVTSNGTTAANRIFCFGAGTIGQVLIIEWTSSTNKGEIINGGNCSGATGAVASATSINWVPGTANTILELIYNGTNWLRIAGSNN